MLIVNQVASKFWILSLDGAGYAAYLTAEFVAYIESRAYFIAYNQKCIQQRESQRLAMHELFDLIAGSETGAIIASTLAVPADTNKQLNKYWAAKSANFFLENVDRLYVDSIMPSYLKTLIIVIFFIVNAIIAFKVSEFCLRNKPLEIRLHKLLELLKLKKQQLKGSAKYD